MSVVISIRFAFIISFVYKNVSISAVRVLVLYRSRQRFSRDYLDPPPLKKSTHSKVRYTINKNIRLARVDLTWVRVLHTLFPSLNTLFIALSTLLTTLITLLAAPNTLLTAQNTPLAALNTLLSALNTLLAALDTTLANIIGIPLAIKKYFTRNQYLKDKLHKDSLLTVANLAKLQKNKMQCAPFLKIGRYLENKIVKMSRSHSGRYFGLSRSVIQSFLFYAFSAL